MPWLKLPLGSVGTVFYVSGRWLLCEAPRAYVGVGRIQSGQCFQDFGADQGNSCCSTTELAALSVTDAHRYPTLKHLKRSTSLQRRKFPPVRRSKKFQPTTPPEHFLGQHVVTVGQASRSDPERGFHRSLVRSGYDT